MSEKKLIEFASMPDIEEQLRDRMEALTQAQVRRFYLYLNLTPTNCLLNIDSFF